MRAVTNTAAVYMRHQQSQNFGWPCCIRCFVHW